MSTSTFYDICDFVPQAVNEDLLVWGQGDQQLVIKLGPKKPKLESLKWRTEVQEQTLSKKCSVYQPGTC